MNKIKVGDQVQVTCGKAKGKRGEVKKIIRTEKSCRVVVEGVNLSKKHQKPNPNLGQDGGVIDIAMPMDISNVAFFDAATGDISKVGIRLNDAGKKVRFTKKSSTDIG